MFPCSVPGRALGSFLQQSGITSAPRQEVQITTNTVVRGDIVVLGTGDVVPAERGASHRVRIASLWHRTWRSLTTGRSGGVIGSTRGGQKHQSHACHDHNHYSQGVPVAHNNSSAFSMVKVLTPDNITWFLLNAHCSSYKAGEIHRLLAEALHLSLKSKTPLNCHHW